MRLRPTHTVQRDPVCPPAASHLPSTPGKPAHSEPGHTALSPPQTPKASLSPGQKIPHIWTVSPLADAFITSAGRIISYLEIQNAFNWRSNRKRYLAILMRVETQHSGNKDYLESSTTEHSSKFGNGKPRRRSTVTDSHGQ